MQIFVWYVRDRTYLNQNRVNSLTKHSFVATLETATELTTNTVAVLLAFFSIPIMGLFRKNFDFNLLH